MRWARRQRGPSGTDPMEEGGSMSDPQGGGATTSLEEVFTTRGSPGSTSVVSRISLSGARSWRPRTWGWTGRSRRSSSPAQFGKPLTLVRPSEPAGPRRARRPGQDGRGAVPHPRAAQPVPGGRRRQQHCGGSPRCRRRVLGDRPPAAARGRRPGATGHHTGTARVPRHPRWVVSGDHRLHGDDGAGDVGRHGRLQSGAGRWGRRNTPLEQLVQRRHDGQRRQCSAASHSERWQSGCGGRHLAHEHGHRCRHIGDDRDGSGCKFVAGCCDRHRPRSPVSAASVVGVTQSVSSTTR